MPINEDQFLTRLFTKIRVDDTVVVPPGDDCAAIKLDTGRKDFIESGNKEKDTVGLNVFSTQKTSEKNEGELLLLSVDQLSEDIHYFSQTAEKPTSPELAGRKLLARSISDIAAMGGKPRYALVAISMGPGYSTEWLEKFTEGLLGFAKEMDVNIVGGDLAAARGNVASLTVLGSISRADMCLRNQAQTDDRIFVTGNFGAALQTEKHLRFRPRIDEALWLTKNQYTRAMIDVSDGLLKDLERVCRSSQLAAVLNDGSIPRTVLSDTKVPLTNAYLDGEDYELLFAVSPAKSKLLGKEWPFTTALSEIGYFCRSEEKKLIANENGVDLITKYGRGFDHFSKVNGANS